MRNEVPATSIESIGFYAAVFAVGALSTLGRAIRDGDFVDWRHLSGACFTAGFLSCGIVSFLVARGGDANDGHWFYLGVAALIGVLGKEQDKLARGFLSRTINGIKIAFTSKDEKE